MEYQLKYAQKSMDRESNTLDHIITQIEQDQNDAISKMKSKKSKEDELAASDEDKQRKIDIERAIEF